jgi:hypothetical protein
MEKYIDLSLRLPMNKLGEYSNLLKQMVKADVDKYLSVTVDEQQAEKVVKTKKVMKKTKKAKK